MTVYLRYNLVVDRDQNVRPQKAPPDSFTSALDPQPALMQGSAAPSGASSKGGYMGVYTVTGIKTFRGHDGQGLNANLCRDGKKVAFLLDEGCGGDMMFDWIDSKEEALFDAFIAEEKARIPEGKKNEFGMTERDYFDGATWVNKAVDDHNNNKRFKRMCKTKTLFQVEGDPESFIGADSFRVIETVKPGVREHIERKFAGKKVRILNDELVNA